MSFSGFFDRLAWTALRVRWLRQTRPRNCVQTVVAIALGLSIETVEREAGTDDTLDIPATLGLLSRFGIFSRPISARLVADFWPVYYRQSGGRRLRGLGFKGPAPDAGRDVGHAYFLYGNQCYDPASGARGPLDPERLRQLDWIVLFPESLERHGPAVAPAARRPAVPAGARA